MKLNSKISSRVKQRWDDERVEVVVIIIRVSELSWVERKEEWRMGMAGGPGAKGS